MVKIKDLVIINSWKYNVELFKYVKKLSNNFEKLCYFALNKSYSSLVQNFDSQGIKKEKFVFMDLISPTIFRKNENNGCVYLDSHDLNYMANELLNVVKLNKVDMVIFDSISSLLVYNNEQEVLKFIDYIIAFFETLNVNIVMFCSNDDIQNTAIREIKMRVNQVKQIE